MRRPAVSVLAATLCAALLGAPAAPAKTPAPARAKLVAFASCRALVGYAHRNAARAGGVGVPMRVGGGTPVALASPVAPGQALPVATVAPAPAAPSGAKVDSSASGSAESGAPAFSPTNVQEAGVDEPDLLKTDGRLVYVADGDGRLRVIDVTGATPQQVGALALDGHGAVSQLLLRGTRLLVLSTAYLSGATTTVLTEVDVTDPAAPKVARTMTLEGTFVDARMVGGTVRVVVSSSPAPEVVGRPIAPASVDGASPAAPSLARAPLRTFVPATTIRSRISGRTYRRGVVPCDDVRRPDAFSGLGLLTVLTVDLDKGLYDVDRDAVLAGAQNVYASPTSLYVASQRYVPGLADATDVPTGLRTEIHRFDASAPGATSYAGSGTVPGFVLNDYALSEQDGALRVATTDEPSWLPEGGQATPAESRVTVLSPRPGGALAQVGQVGGLGKGQRIFGVRFVGTTGYVVTFRQTDPLYTLDLSKPDAPRVLGALEIPGYSAYLHPLGDGLLLGIGQEADAAGSAQGTQVSLFDVSDLAHPRRTQHVVFGNGSSDSEFDPHAFLWWAPTRTAVLPLQIFPRVDGDGGFTGAVGLRVTADAIAEIGRTSHAAGDLTAPIGRSLVVGDRLYTLSSLGLQASRLDTLAPVGFVRFSA